MELNERNIIIDDSLNRIAEAGMESYITHAYCSAGECEVWYGGSQLHFQKGVSPEVSSAHERGRFSLEKFPPLMSAASFRTETTPRSRAR